jgi:hypothetical protein
MILTETRTYDSRNIKASVYNFITKDLTLTFKGGREYKYKDVDEITYKQFSNAESVGSEFHILIKDLFEFENLE